MKARRKESGFALLLVFLLAACVAIMLYMEVPRVAFEAERQRELLLVDRGNQFKRAIQVFVTDKTNNPTHRYPSSIEELETFNNHRYLRHRYLDPMTGKDEWRLVHINGGVLTDSVTTQLNAKGAQPASSTPNPPEYISTQAFLDSGSGGNRGGGAARAMGRRPSDSAQPGAPGDANLQAGGSPGTQGSAGGANPAGMPPGNGLPPGSVPGQPGINGLPVIPAPGGAAQPVCTVFIGGCPATPASGQPGNAVNSQGGAIPPANPGTPGSAANQPGFGPPGLQMDPQAQTAAANMINGLLTQPRPQGMPPVMGTTVGGGLAGVASKYDAEGIIVINERTAINEWEFIFDMTKYRPPPNPVSGTVGTPVSPMGGGPGGTPVAPVTPSGPPK